MPNDLDHLPALAAEIGNLCRLANRPDVRAYRGLVDRLAPVLAAYAAKSVLEGPPGDDAIFPLEQPVEMSLGKPAPAGAERHAKSEGSRPTLDCPLCGGKVTPKRGGGKPRVYCSSRCRIRAADRRAAARARAAKAPPAGADRPPESKGSCQECGGKFTISKHGGRKRYCGDKCRKRASIRRWRGNGAAHDHQPDACKPELPPRRGSPFGARQQDAVEPDPLVTKALDDIAQLPRATAVFGPRPEPPAVPWTPESSERPGKRAYAISL